MRGHQLNYQLLIFNYQFIMRLSQGFFPTQKEVPADAIVPSHQLMLRAGLMRQLGAGIFSFLPLGYAVMKKVMQIIREEMDAIGGQEFHLPALNPIELWEETDRVKAFGDIMFHVKNRPLVLAPTHEEVITAIAKNYLKSYKDLPQIWYQIQAKFRNEPRPKSGVLRGRQFTMKDSYSMDATWEGLDNSYDLHAEAYKKIYTRCGLKFFIVGASSGAMGGSRSQEFMVESQAGEDALVLCDKCDYAANIEVATSKISSAQRFEKSESIKEIHTPNVKTIDEVSAFLKMPLSQCAKSLVYIHEETPVLIFMLGNDQLNETKLQSVLSGNLRPAHPEELLQLTGANAGSIGPIGLKAKFKIIADKRLENANNLVCGANKNDYHIINVDFNRDVKIDEYHDLRTVEDKELCPHCNNPLRITKAIEVGHIFKLGTKYSESMKANFLDEEGKEHPLIMGSYGIGVERIIACFIEQHHDEYGIKWEKSITPYDVHLICVNANSEEVVKVSEEFYQQLQQEKISVLYDDRKNVSPGFKFKDADLLGIPLQIIVGEKNLKDGKIEIKNRQTGKRELINKNEVFNFVNKYINEFNVNLPSDGVQMDVVIKELIVKTLILAEGNQSKAAKMLNISRSQLRYRLDRHNINFENLNKNILKQEYIYLPSDGVQMDVVVKELIIKTLILAEGNQSKAAKMLSISRSQLRYELDKYKIEVQKSVILNEEDQKRKEQLKTEIRYLEEERDKLLSEHYTEEEQQKIKLTEEEQYKNKIKDFEEKIKQLVDKLDELIEKKIA